MSRMRATKNGHDPRVIVSLLQKAVRRNRPDLAGWAASELILSTYGEWMWRRLCVIGAEDVAALVMDELLALREACTLERKARGKTRAPTRVYAMKAVLLLCGAWKSREADHLSNLIVDAHAISDEDLVLALEEAEQAPDPMPGWVFDVHTARGRKAGETRAEFFAREHEALTPRIGGLFDHLAGGE